MTNEAPPADKQVESISSVRIRFAGDSGDGMQLTGTQFTEASAIVPNDLSTFPNYPAEIRAPAGTIPGVSSFQIHIADHDILTPGDNPDVLVVMNPAALQANIADLIPGGMIIANVNAFSERNLAKADYVTNPLTDGSLDTYRLVTIPMEDLTKEAVKESGVKGRAMLRSKNFFALGLLVWMYNRPKEPTLKWNTEKFGKIPEVKVANELAFRAGYNFGITTELFTHTYQVEAATDLKRGEYTNVTGNQSLAWGLIAAAEQARLPLFYGSYPITPASDILHELSRHKNFGVRTFQAEDEIAAVGTTLGAAFGGHLAATGTSGPGLALKSETISLALMTELPMIIVNVQRGGPSTGLPTKTEQSDLLIAVFGRHGEAPLPVIAASSPSDAFECAIEAARIALKYMTPVILLSDGYIANSAEPWCLPALDSLPDISVPFTTEPNGEDGSYLPYLRNETTLARPWAVPGTPGLEHRVGGIEKHHLTGNVNYRPENHELMTLTRENKIEGIAADIAPIEIDGDGDGEVLIVGWGSTTASIRAGVRLARADGHAVDRIHLRHLNPFPPNLEEILGRYDKILIPELNRGQLWRLLRMEYLTKATSYSKVQGQPFKGSEILQKILEMLSS